MPPIICFGQQPCGFFPKRFLVAKLHTARKLHSEIGGKIIFFFHDADHDPRETRTTLRHRQSGQPMALNFEFENKLQRKYVPLFLKRIPPVWYRHMLQALPNYVDPPAVEAFRSTAATLVADFCLDMYRRMGLLDGIDIARSSDPAFRRAACDIPECYADVPYQNEIVRARVADNTFTLHEGGNAFITLPSVPLTRDQISPARDTRLRWMQSVVHCTHYICGAGEQAYLRKEDAPEITYVPRETIERSDEAYTDIRNPAVDLLAVGAHPDDIEFGCGAVIARETRGGAGAHCVVCSHGEAATHGTSEQRIQESQAAAALLGASLEFLLLDGDAHLEIRAAHVIALAGIIRKVRPRIVLAPTLVANQHPDHARLGALVRDAVRLARYGGVDELKALLPHGIQALFFYAITPDAELEPERSILIDVSDPAVLAAWKAAMAAHGSQRATRDYIDLQLTRAHLHGLRAGVTHALPLYPNDPLVLGSLAGLKGARHF